MKETGWYSGDQKPARIGVYQRSYCCGLSGFIVRYSYWDGKKFGISQLTADKAIPCNITSGHQSIPWRGLRR